MRGGVGETGVAASAVGEDLDVVEDRVRQLDPDPPLLTIEQLYLQR